MVGHPHGVNQLLQKESNNCLHVQLFMFHPFIKWKNNHYFATLRHFIIILIELGDFAELFIHVFRAQQYQKIVYHILLFSFFPYLYVVSSCKCYCSFPFYYISAIRNYRLPIPYIYCYHYNIYYILFILTKNILSLILNLYLFYSQIHIFKNLSFLVNINGLKKFYFIF